MEPNKNCSSASIDPDYEKYNLALKEFEEKESEENQLTSETLYNTIAEEFDKEVTFRQQQLEEIEDKICKAQKLLHLMRYVLISSYYNKRSLEYASTSDNLSSNFDSQSRIHPAVKKLLGNNSFEALAARGKRKVHSKNVAASEHSQTSNVKKIKLKESVSDSMKNNNNLDSIDNVLKRKKTKRRILVGNISKWMPSLENDNTTHKWMVYVRGTKESPDISHLVEKVVFYLHPSYKPHNVVEINEYPFHLSRRGWGEFPLRVQIFFKSPLNKPVSIVHNLKLDKTYTGRQTLGSETVVDLFLHDDETFVKSEPEPPCDKNDTFLQSISNDDSSNACHYLKSERLEEENRKVECKSEISNIFKVENSVFEVDNDTSLINCDASSSNFMNFEHDYYDDKNNKEETATGASLIDVSLLDHNYSLPYKDLSDTAQNLEENSENVNDSNETDKNTVFGSNNLIADKQKLQVGVSKGKCIIKTFTTASGQPIKVLPQSFNKVLLSNGNVLHIKLLKSPLSLVAKNNCDTSSERLSCTGEGTAVSERYKIVVPKESFKSMGEILPYLFRKLPLWSEMAEDPCFKCVYPYVARSQDEFLSWNVGKRLSSEWTRAKTVKKILNSGNFHGSELWNTKSLFMYSRSHGYSPSSGGGILFRSPSRELELLRNCFSGALLKKSFTLNSINNDCHIEVVHDNDLSSTKNAGVIDVSDTSLRHHCSFVKDAALDCGVILKSEEIEEGVTWNGSERIILEAVRCLADNLIRRARFHKICQENCSEICEIGVNEIKLAMNERSEIRYIKEFQKKRLVKDFFS